ncbi:MAG: 16S rRNA (uracil(1498)-N(3))-methyltransferase [Gammaproteobacteria bacterium]|nr:16S rRNA (uracil(1498)-N(3))-methyltransferase [Gammaproteobacteria bacterium]
MPSSSRKIRSYSQLPLNVGDTVELPKRSSHHLVKVLRLDSNDAIELFNGDGFNYQATLKLVGKSAHAEILSKSKNIAEASIALNVVQGISRGDKMDTTIQKCVELGVCSIIPVYTAHSIKPLAVDRANRKHEHWQQIAVSAAEQCGRSVVPKVHAPIELNHYLSSANHSPEEPTHLKLVLDPMGTSALDRHAEVAKATVLVGPETGFSDQELTAALSKGFSTIVLGPRILRTETAAPAALAAMQSLFGDFLQ